jgi:hypothetical protein
MPEPFEVDGIFVQQYASNFRFVAQQKESVFENAVSRETNIQGQSKSIDFVHPREARPIEDRYGDTPLWPQQYSRRWIDLQPYEDSDLITDPDKLRMLKDPQSAIVQNMVMGMKRAIDKNIIAAMGGLSRAKDGSIALPVGQKIAHSGTGMTKEKLNQALKRFRVQHVGPEDGEELFVAMSGYQLYDLLNDPGLTNTEYWTVGSIVDGKLKDGKIMGFTVKQYQDLPTSMDGTSNVMSAFVWAKSGTAYGVGKEIRTNVAPDPGKRFYPRVYCSMDIGAVRGEENKVMQIDCIYM